MEGGPVTHPASYFAMSATALVYLRQQSHRWHVLHLDHLIGASR